MLLYDRIRTIPLLRILAISFLLHSCNNFAKKEDIGSNTTSTVIPSTIIHTRCDKDTSITYHLILPEGYEKEKAYPLFLLFDPHAQAEKVTKRYYDIASEQQVLIACSDNSKNGLPGEQLDRIAQITLNDLLDDFKIDTNNIYVAGFSGGAMVATRAAQKNTMIKGIVGIGSPMLTANAHDSFSQNYIGLVGDHDFNFIEMYKQHKSFKNNKHELLVFDGKHEWPNKELMQLAIKWQLYNSNNNLADLNKEIAPYQFAGRYSEEEMVMEQMLIQNHLKAVGVKDLTWWKEVVKNTKSDAEIRSLNYVSMVCYMYIDELLKRGDITNAQRLSELYKLVDPENPDVFYFKSIISMMANNKQDALAQLKNAADIGLNDITKISDHPLLKTLTNEEAFSEIREKIKTNQLNPPLP